MNRQLPYRFVRWPGLVGAVVLAVSAFAVSGCGYPQVSNKTYEYAKALYSITNRKAADRLEGIESQVGQSMAEGDISDREAEWLRGIIKDAKEGRWERASETTRKMMDDQVQR